ncbi:PP2C family protein-serine/threonine phosphatase [Arthrobacter sp. H14]|uniref:PP2C family protein-serine/threonine phosphatase n=1 Tax=Arthrobacter sp. H14 TaxID=1312959 RepID=UPI0004B107D5|nr:protein phosphatase 2C domain-containing protein [Arthrobacter sp. H14]
MNPPDASTTPPLHIVLACGYASDRGSHRELNEDSLLSSDPMFAVADGMGGHEAGEVASGICVQTLGKHPLLAAKGRLLTISDVCNLVNDADAAIRTATGSRSGTTLSGVVLVEDGGGLFWLIFNVGDSRTYLFNGDGLEQITVDHSEVQELMQMGVITAQEAAEHPRRSVITKALGTGSKAAPDLILLPAQDGDRILICSDGLTGEINDEQIHRIMSTLPHPQHAADSLVQVALDTGGQDNVTVMVINASV